MQAECCSSRLTCFILQVTLLETHPGFVSSIRTFLGQWQPNVAVFMVGLADCNACIHSYVFNPGELCCLLVKPSTSQSMLCFKAHVQAERADCPECMLSEESAPGYSHCCRQSTCYLQCLMLPENPKQSSSSVGYCDLQTLLFVFSQPGLQRPSTTRQPKMILGQYSSPCRLCTAVLCQPCRRVSKQFYCRIHAAAGRLVVLACAFSFQVLITWSPLRG